MTAVVATLALVAALWVIDAVSRRWLRHERPPDRDHLDALHRIHRRQQDEL